MYRLLEKLSMMCRSKDERRRELSLRLRRMFSMDALEGQLDCLARSVKR